MRVTLLHNKSAGSENHSRADLKDSLRRGGHALVDAVSDVEALLVSLADRSCDLVVVAGGDGTVSRAACALADRNLPLAILPLGTANNTARCLGIEGDIDTLITGWAAVLIAHSISPRSTKVTGYLHFRKPSAGEFFPKSSKRPTRSPLPSDASTRSSATGALSRT